LAWCDWWPRDSKRPICGAGSDYGIMSLHLIFDIPSDRESDGPADTGEGSESGVTEGLG